MTEKDEAAIAEHPYMLMIEQIVRMAPKMTEL